MSKSDKFLKIAEGHKNSKKKEKFSGTYSDYLKILEKDKELLTESENIDEITENVRATSKLIESIKREIGL